MPWHYHYKGANNGGKCAMHTVTESVLTNITNRPNSPVTHGNLPAANNATTYTRTQNYDFQPIPYQLT